MANKGPNKKIADNLVFETEWSKVDRVANSDHATSAAITILLDETSLTDAYDAFQQKTSKSVQLSAYRLAEWISWNWWRLRWEPLRSTSNWRLAHRLTSIGGGFVWPNICIYSDGQQLMVDTKPTESRSSEPLRYVKNDSRELRASGFEKGVDVFVNSVCERLLSEGIKDANLFNIWNDLQIERKDPKLVEYRKLEAMLGFDPDKGESEVIKRLLGDVDVLGTLGVEELAATSSGRSPPSKEEITGWASSLGVKRDPRNALKLADKSEASLPNNVEAWRRGKVAARALRDQVRLGERPLETRELLEMIGSSTSQLKHFKSGSPISFELDQNVATSTVVLRDSAFESAHRFDLARLIGDNVAHTSFDGRLTPITSSYTYRQKLQRAFAAEFLSPFHVVDRMMEGEYNDDASVEKVASYFNISPLSVKASLANNGKIHPQDVWVA